jgi:hypothetical protein
MDKAVEGGGKGRRGGKSGEGGTPAPVKKRRE